MLTWPTGRVAAHRCISWLIGDKGGTEAGNHV